jgi:hypothetical protein
MANTFDPFIPQWWAMGTLAVLHEALVAVPLFNQDFSEQFAKGGQVVNTRRPRKMTATRKAKTTDIAAQDVGADNVAITLNQQIYNSFTVHDLDQQYSMEDLITTYLRPAGFALAKMADAVVLSQAAQFLLAGNVAGNSGQKVYENIVDGRNVMDNNLADSDGRHLIMNPNTEAKLLKDQTLYQVNTSGSGRALRNGEIGNLVGVDLFKTQNLRQNALNVSATGVQTLTANADVAAGQTTFTTTAQSTVATAAGDWVSIGGVPYKVTNVAGAGPYTFTLNRALGAKITNSDKIYAVKGTTLNTDYAVGYVETIVLNPQANQYTPKVGDWLDIKGKLYGIVANDATNTYLLDRPLEDAVTAASDKVQTVPPGSYSFMAQRDCMTVVLRNLAPTRPGAGALSAVATYNGLGVRAQMWYNGTKQTMQVSLDFLMGIQVLDTNMGTIVVS